LNSVAKYRLLPSQPFNHPQPVERQARNQSTASEAQSRKRPREAFRERRIPALSFL
jgi:hypothetical protein